MTVSSFQHQTLNGNHKTSNPNRNFNRKAGDTAMMPVTQITQTTIAIRTDRSTPSDVRLSLVILGPNLVLLADGPPPEELHYQKVVGSLGDSVWPRSEDQFLQCLCSLDNALTEWLQASGELDAAIAACEAGQN